MPTMSVEPDRLFKSLGLTAKYFYRNASVVQLPSSVKLSMQLTKHNPTVSVHNKIATCCIFHKLDMNHQACTKHSWSVAHFLISANTSASDPLTGMMWLPLTHTTHLGWKEDWVTQLICLRDCCQCIMKTFIHL